MPSKEYTIVAGGERFVFTRDQLESEPGNYFATYFFGDFEEATNGVKELRIERDPLLFTLIQAHLRGYKVLPIQIDFVPKYMSKSGALENLRRDADFFGLSGLIALIDEIKRPESEEERGIEGGTAGERIYRFSSHRLRRDTAKNADGSKQTTAITPNAVQAMLLNGNLYHHYDQICDSCPKVSKGWQVETWLNDRGAATHYVIESKMV